MTNKKNIENLVLKCNYEDCKAKYKDNFVSLFYIGSLGGGSR
jgi:hypothetical protein